MCLQMCCCKVLPSAAVTNTQRGVYLCVHVLLLFANTLHNHHVIYEQQLYSCNMGLEHRQTTLGEKKHRRKEKDYGNANT